VPPPARRPSSEAPVETAMVDPDVASDRGAGGDGARGAGEAAQGPSRSERPIADTAPLPQQSEARASGSSRHPAPARLRPLDIVLIIVTFGLYGIVLWARQRRPGT
jgi:hypothetical protein